MLLCINKNLLIVSFMKIGAVKVPTLLRGFDEFLSLLSTFRFKFVVNLALDI
jgi:hypothetical protein